MNNIMNWKFICRPYIKMTAMIDGYIYGVMVTSLLKRFTNIFVVIIKFTCLDGYGSQLVKPSTKSFFSCC
jgi:hypothetical protein